MTMLLSEFVEVTCSVMPIVSCSVCVQLTGRVASTSSSKEKRARMQVCVWVVHFVYLSYNFPGGLLREFYSVSLNASSGSSHSIILVHHSWNLQSKLCSFHNHTWRWRDVHDQQGVLCKFGASLLLQGLFVIPGTRNQPNSVCRTHYCQSHLWSETTGLLFHSCLLQTDLESPGCLYGYRIIWHGILQGKVRVHISLTFTVFRI